MVMSCSTPVVSISKPHKRESCVRKLLHGLFSMAIVLAISAQAADLPAVRPHPLGKMVDLGGYKLHLYCTGAGRRTVVFLNGAGDFSFDWYLVQRPVSKFARACSYDRAGEAWSELGPKPRTGLQEAHDLGRLLRAAHEKGPFLLVGQSMGGTIARMFQMEYPNEVAGIVFVDASHEDGRLFMNGKLARPRDLSKGRPIPAVRDGVTEKDKLSDDDIAQIKKTVAQYDIKPEIDPPFDKLPVDIQKLRLWALAQDSHFAATDDDYGPEEGALMYERRHATEHPLGKLPVIVLSRSRNEYPPRIAEQMTMEHEAQQADLAALSENSKQIVVPESGHHIQLDRPDAVVAAIKELVDKK